MNKFGAVIVAYNPDNNIISTSKVLASMLGIDQVIIVDNSTQENQTIQDLLTLGYKVWPMYGNQGIAAALNSGIGCLIAQGCEVFFCFDQDSKIDLRFIRDMILNWESSSINNVGMLCPSFFDINSATEAKFTKIDHWRVRNFGISKEDKIRDRNIETSFAITSGSLLSRRAFLKVGGFDEDYFIDHVDSEFCLRLISKGYRVMIAPNIQFFHSVGKRSKEKLLLLTIKPNNHAPIRRYYIFRNGIITQKRYYKDFPGFTILNFARNVHEILSVIFFEENKCKKIKAMFYGIYDGVLDRTGKNEDLWKKLL